MNKPHVHAELIKAWADGAIIEYYSDSCKRWVLVPHNCPSWSTLDNYRVKPEPKIVHKIGNKYKYDSDTYMIVSCDNSSAVLVVIDGTLLGFRATDAVTVNDFHNITEVEFKKIIGCYPIKNFELIND